MSTIHLPEIVVPGKRLGRHLNHDPRSLRYLLPEAETVVSVEWPRRVAILDQGDLGSCTGNATVGALGTGPLYDALADAGWFTRGLTLDENLAVAIYSAAEKVDGGAGYPPEDQGSSGLSVATVAKTDGYVSGYTHATSVAAAHTALSLGPVLVGSYWYSGMDEPVDGVVHATGTVRGGHEYLCRGYDAARDLFTLDNSWGSSWGDAGSFYYDTPTFTKLLAQHGDVTALVPLSQPAPTPTPAPAPSDALATWLETAQPWVAARHSSKSNVAMQAATRDYIASLS